MEDKDIQLSNMPLNETVEEGNLKFSFIYVRFVQSLNMF